MNTLRIHAIRRETPRRLAYRYTVEGEWKQYFRTSPFSRMWVEYDEDIASVPDGAAVLPLVGNVIVLAALMDATIYVDEIDRDFYNCVGSFITGFETIMPKHVHFKKTGLIEAKKLVDTPSPEDGQKADLLFFSGGVDATSSLISHLDEKPVLVNIWGADVRWYEEDTWRQAVSFNQQVADRYGLRLATIRSNLRLIFDDEKINRYSLALVNDYWWSAFHHSVAMMCLAAPMACGKQKLYFAGTYYQTDSTNWGTYVTASDPAVDDHLRFCGCQVVHDGYEYSRFRKIERIVQFYSHSEQKPFLRVCYLSNTGKNCGHCEKCASAIQSLLLLGADPKDYGFPYDPHRLPIDFAAGLQEMARAERYAFLSFYTDVHAAYRAILSPQEVPPELRVFYDTDLETLADFLCVPCNEALAIQQGAAVHLNRRSTPLSALLRRLERRYRILRQERGANVRYWVKRKLASASARLCAPHHHSEQKGSTI